MIVKRRTVLALVLACVGVAVLAIAQLAAATHPRPQGASPIRVSLVPSYEQCTAPNRTHGPPLAFPSCAPPVQTSDFLTVGTPDANGAPAKSVSHFSFRVHTSPSYEIVVGADVTDVRCRPATSANVCNNPNATDGPDYSGELEVDATIRMTDHYNATSPGGGTDAATVVDIPNPVRLQCVNTADTSIGGRCSVLANPVQPGLPNQDWFVGKRVVVEFDQIQVIDGGADGVIGTTPNTLFMNQGVFLP